MWVLAIGFVILLFGSNAEPAKYKPRNFHKATETKTVDKLWCIKGVGLKLPKELEEKRKG